MQEVFFENQTYKISFDSMPDALKIQLPGEKMERYLELLAKVQTHPKSVYPEIKAFSEQFPDVPEVINLLTFAHIQNRKIVEAENLIAKTFENYPHYLFARINYADQCVRKKNFSKIPEIFPTFNLQELYPEKKVFHTSEFRGFLIMMAYYHLALKNKEKALPYFEAAKQIEPNHPGIVYLEKKLFKKPLFPKFAAVKSLFFRR